MQISISGTTDFGCLGVLSAVSCLGQSTMTFVEELCHITPAKTGIGAHLPAFSPFPTFASSLKVPDLSAANTFSSGVSIVEL